MASRKWRRLPWITSGVHLALVVAGVLGILIGTEPDWPLVWLGFMVLDFPISLLFAMLNSLASANPSGFHLGQPYSLVNDVWNFLVPAIFFGVCGSGWWFLLGIWIRRWGSGRSRDERAGSGRAQ